MTNTIDFKTEKTKKDTDKNLIMKDDDGSIWFKYSASYTFDGEYSISFWAQNEDEAKARVEAMKSTMRFDFQVLSEIPAN